MPVLIDALENLPNTFDSIGSRLDNAALLHKAGVKIAFTQFGESHNARKVRQLAGNAAAHGLPKDAALAGLTAQPAEIFGLGATRGHIAPAKSPTSCYGAAIHSKSPASPNKYGSPAAPSKCAPASSNCAIVISNGCDN